MKKRKWITVGLILGGMQFATFGKPNIVLIMADDIGIESIGAYGCESYQTPRIDQMAREGMLFSHCYSQPLCTPSRVQIMSGKYNNRNYTAFGELRPGETTFANLLQEAGYATAIAGKWQLGGNAQTIRDFGFDQFCIWQVDGRRGSRYNNPEINQNGEWLIELENSYGPDVFADFVCGFIEENKDRPFFIYYPEVLPHSPFQPTPNSNTPLWNNQKSETRYYSDMVSYLDKIVGRVMDAVDGLAADRETLILFVGDNGTNRRIKDTVCNGKIMPGGKGLPIDAGTHVPLVVRWVGRAPVGGTCDDLIDFSDFLPTLAAAVGVRIPESFLLDGRSFLSQLNGEGGAPRDWVYCHYNPRFGKVVPTRFARDKQWKLYGDGRFYHIPADRDEKHPVQDKDLSKEILSVKTRLQQVIDRMPSEF